MVRRDALDGVEAFLGEYRKDGALVVFAWLAAHEAAFAQSVDAKSETALGRDQPFGQVAHAQLSVWVLAEVHKHFVIVEGEIRIRFQIGFDTVQDAGGRVDECTPHSEFFARQPRGFGHVTDYTGAVVA